MNYADKLKDPRWQRRRLEIFSRDAWACQQCGNGKSELHVHHKEYSGDPWDAPDNCLITMCASCHKAAHDDTSKKDKDLALLLAYPARFNEYVEHQDKLVSQVAAIFDNNRSTSMAMLLERYREHPEFQRLARAAAYSA